MSEQFRRCVMHGDAAYFLPSSEQSLLLEGYRALLTLFTTSANCGPGMRSNFCAPPGMFGRWGGRGRGATTSTSSIRQLLGAANAQTAHPATSSTAPAHQRLGSVNAETTSARAPAAAADRTQRPNATCEGKNG